MGNAPKMPPPPPPKKPEETPPVAVPKPALIPEAVESGAPLPATKLTQEQLSAMRAKRKVRSKWTILVRNITLVLVVIFSGSYAWLQADLLPSNPIFPLFGLEENMGRRAATLKSHKLYLQNQTTSERKKADEKENRIETKNYTIHTSTINALKSQQLYWFDSADEEGKIIFGMMDALPRLETYFNDKDNFEDPQQILQGRPGQISIESMSATRDGVTFSAIGTELFGRVFFLNIEFLQLANSFPFLKNGQIYSFTKSQNREGDEEMGFTVQLQRQKEKEEDPSDSRFSEYLEWLRKVNKQTS